MSGIFLRLVNMSIAASWIVLVVAVLRLLLWRAPKWINCLLWSMVGLRLVMPFPLKSIFSLVPQVDAREFSYPGNPGNLGNPGGLGGQGAPNIQMPAPAPGVPAGMSPAVPAPGEIAAGQALDLLTVLTVIWLVGYAVMLAYALLSYLRLHRRVGASIRLQGNIFICDDIASPFLLGVFRPRIYLPSGISEEQLPYILAHERAHMKQKDHLWKPLGFVLLAVYWFDPVLWLAYLLFCRDIELACDEKVIRGMGKSDKRAYSQALLSCAAPHRTVLISPLAFGEVGIKKRIKSVLHYKRPAFWLTLAAAVVCVVVAVCFLTDPYGTEEVPPEEDGSFSDDAVVNPAPDRRELTADEIAQINAAFDPETDSNIRPGPLSVYLVTNYETPYDLKLSEFLSSFPIDDVVTEPAELEALKTRNYWPFRHDVNLDTAPALPGLLLRIPASDVEAKLREGFGIGLEDLTYTPNWNLMYLEEYDCFYRIANEVLFGYFTCTGGYLEGDTAVLLDENEDRRLELHRSGDGWLFYSLTGRESHDDMQYYDPLSIYGIAAQGQDDSEIAPDQILMPTQTGWAAEAQVQQYQNFLDILEPTQVGNFLIFLSPNDQSRWVDLTWEQSMWFLDQLRTVRLAAAQPTELGADDTGDTVSLHIIVLGEQWTIRHRENRLYFGRNRDNTMWIFDGDSCADIFQTMREATEEILS